MASSNTKAIYVSQYNANLNLILPKQHFEHNNLTT